jgi:TetR/AcrR family tetracycline transcriptional repressor
MTTRAASTTGSTKGRAKAAPSSADAPKVSRDAIVATALRILEAEGPDGLSMRKVGAACGVRGPSLYWHFTNKDELLDEMVDAALGDVDAGDPDQPWIEQAATIARSLRAVLLAHPGLATIIPTRLALGPNALDKIEAGIAAGRRAGFSARQAGAAYYAVTTFVIGFVLQERAAPLAELGGPDPDAPARREVVERVQALPGETHPNLVGMADEITDMQLDDLFEFCLTALLRGLEAQAAPTPRTGRRAR